jgi:hypothetical protein
MMKKCPHCGEEYEDDALGGEESASHESNPGDSEEDFGERIAKAVVAELKKNSTTAKRSSFEDEEEKWPA